MTSRILMATALALALAACGSKNTKPEAKPAPLPAFKPTAELRVQWSAGLASLEESMLAPAFAGGSVYAADRKGDLARFDAAGRQVWKVRTLPRLSGGVATNGERVVVASSDGDLAAHDAADGKQVWKISVGGEVLAEPLLTGELAIVRIGDNKIVAYGLADGSRRWVYQRAQAPLALRSYGGLSQADGLVFAGFAGGKLVALTTAGGLQRWEATVAQPKGSNEIERLTDVVGKPVVQGDMVCVSSFQGRVACVERAGGSLRWARDFSSAAGLAADAGNVFLTDSADAVHALDASTGATVWKQDKLSLRRLGQPLIVGDTLVVADGMGYVHAMSRRDGGFVANYRVDSSGVRAPLQALPNQAFAVQAVDGDLYALNLRR
ncbi:MAG: outer membrane protein assembly factor BamB [Candidatus Dactylopiibacterium sp.]|nr:outer membrane protein assembly factor BamB [Candidatus Dactylopiibacterium sp.]